MPYFGCHLSPSGGYAAMVRTAASLGGDTFQFFTRNPRGSRAKAPDLADAARAGALMKEGAFGPVVAHGAYTMNLCTQMCIRDSGQAARHHAGNEITIDQTVPEKDQQLLAQLEGE